MANTVRRSPWQLFGLAIALVYGVGATVLAVAGLLTARLVTHLEVLHEVLTVAGSAVLVGFLLFPLVFGVDDTLDPRRFSLFGIGTRKLATGLALAALIGVPSLAVVVASAASVVTWSRDVGSTLIALVCAAAYASAAVLGSRVTSALAALAFAGRRSRDAATVLGVLVILAVPVLLWLLVGRVAGGGDAASGLADVLGWTPLGAAVSAPGRAALGDWAPALLQALIAVATPAALWVAWQALVGKLLVTPEHATASRRHVGLGWFARLPGSAGAVAARSMTYWGRDVRYWVSIVLIPVVPFLMAAALLISGVPAHLVVLLPLPVMCLFLGWSVHNDVAYDGTALWLHVASGVSGPADRLGRIFPVLLIGVPLVIVGGVVTAVLYGSMTVLPAVIGLSAAVLLVGAGLSSVASALFPYPATKPGQSAFTQPQSSGGFAALVQSLSFFAIVAAVSPVIALLVLGIVVDRLWLGWAMVAGVSIGVVALVGGVWLGGWIFERRATRLMAFALRNG